MSVCKYVFCSNLNLGVSRVCLTFRQILIIVKIMTKSGWSKYFLGRLLEWPLICVNHYKLALFRVTVILFVFVSQIVKVSDSIVLGI